MMQYKNASSTFNLNNKCHQKENPIKESGRYSQTNAKLYKSYE